MSSSPLLNFLWESRPPDRHIPLFYWKSDDEKNNGKWKTLSFEEYWEKIFCLSHKLNYLASMDKPVILVILNNSLEFDLIEKACFQNGLAFVAIEPHAHPSLIRQVIEDTHPHLIFYESNLQAHSLDSEFNFNKFTLIIKNSPTWEKLFSDDSTNDNNSLSENDFSEKIAYYVLTSGTTGKAKLISYTQKQILGALVELLNHEGGWPLHQKSLCWLPMANLFQRITNLCLQAKQGKIYLWDSPKDIIKGLSEVRPHVFIGIPRFYEKLKAQIEGGSSKLDLLGPFIRNFFIKLYLKRLFSTESSILISGSAPLYKSTLLFYKSHNLPIMEAYGMTECILPIAMNTPSSLKLTTVGKPLIKDITLNSEGKIFIKTPYIGSWNRDSNKTLNHEGYFETEDYGKIDEEGFLTLIGRSSNIIKLSTGRKIQREFVENKLRPPDWVSRILIFGDGSNALFAFVEPNSKLSFIDIHINEIKHIIRSANTNLNSYEKIRGVIINDSPLKIERHELTPNLKIKYTEIEKNYKELFNRVKSNISKSQPSWIESYQDENGKAALFSIDE